MVTLFCFSTGSGYADHKFAFCGFHKDGWIDFHLHHVKQGRLIVCEPSYGCTRQSNVALIQEGAEFKSDSVVVHPKPDRLLSKLCVEMDRQLPRGGGIFSIRAKSDRKQVCIAFLMWT